MARTIGLLAILLGLLGMLAVGVQAAPVHDAARRGDVATLQRLLTQDPGLVKVGDAEFGATPLHWASSAGQTEAAKLLLDKGADVNARNKTAQTPLQMAAGAGQPDTVKLLLERKADVTLVDKDGNTALHYAALNGDPASVEALLAAKADPAARNAAGLSPKDVALARNNDRAVAMLRAAVNPTRPAGPAPDKQNPGGLTVKVEKGAASFTGTPRVVITLENPAPADEKAAGNIIFIPGITLMQSISLYNVAVRTADGRTLAPQGEWAPSGKELRASAPLPFAMRMVTLTAVGDTYAVSYLPNSGRSWRYTLNIPEKPAPGKLSVAADASMIGLNLDADVEFARLVLGPLMFKSSTASAGATTEGVLLLPGQRYIITLDTAKIDEPFYAGFQLTYRYLPATVRQVDYAKPGEQKFLEAQVQVPPATVRTESFYISTARGELTTLEGDALTRLRAKAAEGYAAMQMPTRATLMFVVRDSLGRPLSKASVKAYDEKPTTITIPDNIPDKDKLFTPDFIAKYFTQLDDGNTDMFGTFWSEKMQPDKEYKWVVSHAGFQSRVVYTTLKEPDFKGWVTGLQRFDLVLTPAQLPAITLRATAANGRIDLAWTQPSDPTLVGGYNVFRSLSETRDYASVTQTPLPANTLAYADTTLNQAGIYYYVVQVVAPDGREIARSNVANAQYRGPGDAGVMLLPFLLQLNLPATTSVNNEQLGYMMANQIGTKLSENARVVFPNTVQATAQPAMLTRAQNGDVAAMSFIARSVNARFVVRAVGTNRGLVVYVFDTNGGRDLAAIQRNITSLSADSPLWADIADKIAIAITR